MKVLHLTLKKKWFDMIASGEKKEEYREIKEYWVSRLLKLDKTFTHKQAGITYTDLASAFAYCWGYYGRVRGMEYLLETFVSFKEFDAICFKNGYSKNAPQMTVEFKGIDIGPAIPEWSDNWKGDVFIIKLGKIIDL